MNLDPDDPTLGWVSRGLLDSRASLCAMLKISDGGSNDADGQRNGIVVDPGAPASVASGNPTRSGGGGTSDLWFLLLMLLISTLAIRRRQRLS